MAMDYEDNEEGLWDPPEESEEEWDPSAEDLEFVEENLDADRLDAIEDEKEADDRVTSALAISKDIYKISPAVIAIKDVVIPAAVKDSRKETYLGLSRSVEELGVLNPVHVMVLEGYSEYLDEGGVPDEYEGPKYALLDGLRRVFAAKKNNLEHINAMVWNFKDKDRGAEVSILISMVLNKHQRKSWAEIWYLYQILEEDSTLTPSEIEYLLSLEAGDATKLKEVMTRSDEFPEPQEDLLSKKKTLQQAYNALCKAMKEQNALVKEDLKGVSGMEQAEGIVNDGSDGDKLSDEEVRQILDMQDSFDGDLSDNEFDALVGNDVPAERFEVDGDRHLDPALRAAVLQRDNYTCQISGVGVASGLPTEIALAILQVHHLVPVADGGTNEMSNLITVAQDPHTLIHVIQRRNGRLGMSKEDFDALDSDKQSYIKKVMKCARIAVEADRRLGKTREQIRSDTADSMRFNMPGVIQRQNMDALARAKASEG